jgi:Ca2+-binding RTX toxin-like protein
MSTINNIDGTSNSDNLYGTDGNDVINGGSGYDYISGAGGNDTLAGNTENDYLSGEGGADTYIFNKGDGQDYIYNYDNDGYGNNADTLLFGEGIAKSDISIKREYSDLVLSIKDSTDNVRLSGYFYENGTSNYGLENIKFADGSTLTFDEIKPFTLIATEGDDSIYGYDNNDVTINAGAGNDSIYAAGGNDTLNGGSGYDYINGGSGNDILAGNTDNDYLSGEGGADTYIFNKGDGQDYIYNYDNDVYGSNADSLLFGQGITKSDIGIKREYNDLILNIKNSTDSVRLSGYFYGNGISNYGLENIKFADGSFFTFDEVQAISILPTEGDDTIYLSDNNGVTINGLGGNDTIVGANGNDVLNGNSGYDYLSANDGNDTLVGGADNDLLIGGSGADTYIFNAGDGQDTIYNYDYDAYGTNTDTLLFGAGINKSDIIVKRTEPFNLLLSIKNSTDSVSIDGYFYDNASTPSAIENIKFADGSTLSLEEINTLISETTSTNDNLFGTLNNDSLNGDAGNDTLYGYIGDDVLNGGTGNDTLYGEDGNDTLIGGAGNDRLIGHAGADTYVFGRGDGNDSIDNSYGDYDGYGNNADTLLFGADVIKSDIEARRTEPFNLVLSIKNSTDSITIENYFYDNATSASAIENIKFADGSSLNIEEINTLISITTAADDNLFGSANNDVLNGDAGNDTLYGYIGDDVLNGGTGNDVLYGEDGNDTLVGGSGNDRLIGHSGADTYVFGRGDGMDAVDNAYGDYDAQGTNLDSVQFGTDVAANQLWFEKTGNDLDVSIIGTTDKIRIENWYHNDGSDIANSNQVDIFKTTDGKALIAANVNQLVQAMASFSPPTMGETSLPLNYQNSLNAVIAANWQ